MAKVLEGLGEIILCQVEEVGPPLVTLVYGWDSICNPNAGSAGRLSCGPCMNVLITILLCVARFRALIYCGITSGPCAVNLLPGSLHKSDAAPARWFDAGGGLSREPGVTLSGRTVHYFMREEVYLTFVI